MNLQIIQDDLKSYQSKNQFELLKFYLNERLSESCIQYQEMLSKTLSDTLLRDKSYKLLRGLIS